MTRAGQILPRDEHNEALLGNVHPADWTNPEPAGRYNLVVIGAGTAGLVTAAGAAGLGAKVALVERHLMGGDCLNVGCVPSKALLRSAHAFAEVRDAGRFGVRVADPGATHVDFPAAMERMRELRARISPVDSARRFRDELGVDVFFGDARFTSGREVAVAPTGATQSGPGDARLSYAKAVIATGARPVVPPIPGLAEAGFLTNETVFELTELPRRLLVLGGGPIGCELAQAFRRFGSQVTLVELEPQFLGREDPDAAAVLRAALERDGVDVRLETKLESVESSGAEQHAQLERDGKSETLSVDAILVGVGRAPNIESLGLDQVGVETERTGIVVDDRLRTTHKHIYACGDVCMAYKFTHAADFAARTVIQNALFFGRNKLSALTIPWCTYTDPEIAHVGLYERDAEARGVEVDTYIQEFADIDRAIAEGADPGGFVKIHTAKGKDRILGATIVNRHAGEMISEISVAMAAGMGLGRLASVIHPYPTQAEAIRKLGDAYNRTRLTPTVANLFNKMLALRRGRS
jgi:pyruvate/2-oxoglutarate dehydrogenase complex dihydrolipoamide dehydrogenase (E3) component